MDGSLCWLVVCRWLKGKKMANLVVAMIYVIRLKFQEVDLIKHFTVYGGEI